MLSICATLAVPPFTAISMPSIDAAKNFFRGRFADAEIKATLAIFLRRFFTQAFKRNCAPDGVKVFSFDLSPHGWWIPSDLGVVKLHG